MPACAASGCDRVDCSSVCVRCRLVYYCSRDCQRSHWKEHKRHCKTIESQGGGDCERSARSNRGCSSGRRELHPGPREDNEPAANRGATSGNADLTLHSVWPWCRRRLQYLPRNDAQAACGNHALRAPASCPLLAGHRIFRPPCAALSALSHGSAAKCVANLRRCCHDGSQMPLPTQPTAPRARRYRNPIVDITAFRAAGKGQAGAGRPERGWRADTVG